MFIKRVNAKISSIAEGLEKYVPNVLYIVMILYIAAVMIFAASRLGFEESPGMVIAYFICQDTAGGGFLVWLLIYLTCKPYRGLVFPVLILSIFILLWDIVSYLTSIGVNHPVITGILFCLAASAVLYFIIKDFVCRLKQL